MPLVQEKRRSSTRSLPPGADRAIADVEVVAALERERAARRSADQKRLDIAVRIEAALRHRNQRAAERPGLRRHHQAFDAGIVRQRPERRRHRHRNAARQQAVPAEIEPHDAVRPLDADIERVAVAGERLGVVPAARAQRPAVRPRASAPSRHRRSRSASCRDRRCARAATGSCRSRRRSAGRRRRRAATRCRRIPSWAIQAPARRGIRARRSACARRRADRRLRSPAI